VDEAKIEFDRACAASKRASTSKKRERKLKETVAVEPTRKSSRVRGEKLVNHAVIGDDDEVEDDVGSCHLTCDEYCAMYELTPGPMMTGSFGGWVEESVRVRCGIAASANDAWESNGGGSKDRKPAKGEQARDHAKRMLRKNPNAYFYRHTAPGEDQVDGDWSQAEIDRFVEVAKEYGCGDKWGLFASYIPGRVGYQCSSAYRHHIIPRGLLRDNNWRLTPSGEAIWIGKRRTAK